MIWKKEIRIYCQVASGLLTQERISIPAKPIRAKVHSKQSLWVIVMSDSYRGCLEVIPTIGQYSKRFVNRTIALQANSSRMSAKITRLSTSFLTSTTFAVSASIVTTTH